MEFWWIDVIYDIMMLRLLIQTPCFAVYNLTKIAKCKRKQITCSHQKSFSHLLKVTPKNRFHLFAPTVSCDSCRVIINLVLFIFFVILIIWPTLRNIQIFTISNWLRREIIKLNFFKRRTCRKMHDSLVRPNTPNLTYV